MLYNYSKYILTKFSVFARVQECDLFVYIHLTPSIIAKV